VRWRKFSLAWAGLAIALTAAYVLAAWVGLVLLGGAQGVPLIWPAAGIAVGALIALGRRARVPIALGVLVGTAAPSLLAGRTPWTAVVLGLCSAGEAVLTADLVDRWCGRPFRFDDWRGLWGFLAATALAAAGASFVAAIMLELEPGATAALHDLWRMWASANGLGIMLVAPVLVGIYHLVAEPMPRGELVEGGVAVTLLAVATLLVFAAPRNSPLAHIPPAVLFPFYLWIAARCRPLLAAAAALAGSAAVIGANMFHLGAFAEGRVAVPTMQTILLIGSLCALSLSALFAERRRSEAALRESNERLRLALGGADLGVWSLDLRTGAFESDERDGRINGHDPLQWPRTIAEARRNVHPDDLVRLDAAFTAARRTGAPCRSEYRLLAGNSLPRHPRWVAMEGRVVNDDGGRPVRLLGVTRDITERKLAEQALAERTDQLALAGRAGLVGSFAYDVASGTIQMSPGFAAIYGLPEETAEISRESWRRRVDPDDLAGYEVRRERAIAARQRELLAEYRIRRPDGEVRWIEQRTLFDYSAEGFPRRAVGVNIDITERKHNEEHQALLVAELDHRVKNVLAVVSALLARVGDSGAAKSASPGAGAAELVAALEGRIKSMATAHELLSRRQWHGLRLRELIERELEPYATGSNLEIGGPDVVLQAEAGQALAMVVHELVTNAAKYGALSVEGGSVTVHWTLAAENGCGGQLAIDWREAGGPQVASSARVGYGTSVIRDLVPYELGGSADLAFRTEGVCCHLEVPARWLTTKVGSSGAAPAGIETVSAPVAPRDDDRRASAPN
jgi:PAS domain S-box-containing protein